VLLAACVLVLFISGGFFCALFDLNGVTMSSSEDSEPIEGSSSEDEQEEQHGGDQQVTGATADPQVLQLFWDLASLEQVGTRLDPTAAVQCVAWHIQPRFERMHGFKMISVPFCIDLALRVRQMLSMG
jgi:hypothetical protein